MGLQQVVEAIKKHNNFIITSHIDPDGDSLGSQLALAVLLKKMGKSFHIINDTQVHNSYRFLLEEFSEPEYLFNEGNIIDFNYEAMIVLDCPLFLRVGTIRKYKKDKTFIINIDHHPGNEDFGNVNWVEENKSSVGEMIFRLFRELNILIDKPEAVAMYTAIMTDTGCFRYSNTVSTTHNIVGYLMDIGVDIVKISKNVYESNSASRIKLLGKVLETLRIDKEYNISWIYLTRDMLDSCDASLGDAHDFIDYVRSIKDMVVVIFFKEYKKNEIRVSFRSCYDMDVNKLAAFFGGGGHKKASGCSIYGNIVQVEEKVLNKVREELNKL